MLGGIKETSSGVSGLFVGSYDRFSPAIGLGLFSFFTGIKNLEEIASCLVDATEQPIERPKRVQKAYYSGKKKRHTIKPENRTTLHN